MLWDVPWTQETSLCVLHVMQRLHGALPIELTKHTTPPLCSALDAGAALYVVLELVDPRRLYAGSRACVDAGGVVLAQLAAHLPCAFSSCSPCVVAVQPRAAAAPVPPATATGAGCVTSVCLPMYQDHLYHSES